MIQVPKLDRKVMYCTDNVKDVDGRVQTEKDKYRIDIHCNMPVQRGRGRWQLDSEQPPVEHQI